MSDIIANAQRLLDGATPAPWEVDIDGLEVYSTVDGDAVAHAQTPSDADLIAAAPELAQALAEETYEYAVQVKIGAKWLFLGRGTGGHNFARNAFWFVKKENAQDYMAIGKDMSAPARIVRRRVSPVEVISD